MGMCRLTGGACSKYVVGELLSEPWHDKSLRLWHCQRLHTLPGQVAVAVGTVTFEFPGLCLEFCLHNAATTWGRPSPFLLSLWHLSLLAQQIIALCCPSLSCGRQSYPFLPGGCQLGLLPGALDCPADTCGLLMRPLGRVGLLGADIRLDAAHLGWALLCSHASLRALLPVSVLACPALCACLPCAPGACHPAGLVKSLQTSVSAWGPTLSVEPDDTSYLEITLSSELSQSNGARCSFRIWFFY